MKKEIVINAATAETRIVLLEDDKLAMVFVERPEKERNVGDIYLGKVRKVLNGISAAFVDIGWQQDGFLHFNDISTLYEMPEEENRTSNGNGRRGNVSRINLQAGQEIMVQVTKEPMGGKGPRVTNQLSLPGRFVVLVPNEDSIGVSRKISNPKEKRRLKKIAKSLQDKGYGLIVRTVAVDKDEVSLSEDIERLISSWRRIENKSRTAKAPERLYKEVTLASSVIRDLFGPEIDSLIVDSKLLYKEIVTYLKSVSPQLIDRVELYSDSLPIFDHYDVETEIEKGLRRRVWLEGGGHIVIEHTEAMVTIDVNSGRYVGKSNHEDNSLKINLRAAREVSRQLRLRDIGGIIAIDFIDMLEEKNRKKLYDEMKKELKRDRAKLDVVPVGAFGLMLLTRQRIRPSLIQEMKEPCQACHGTGMLATRETVVTELERWIARYVYHTRKRRIKVIVHPSLHNYLTEGGLKSRNNKLMLRNKLFIRLLGDANQPPTTFKIITLPGGDDVTDQYRH